MAYKRGQHPNSLKNLEKGKFKKGEVSNPHGRPKREFCITSILQEKLNLPCAKDPSKTWAEWLALRALELAGENPAYYRELLDRVEGKVVFPFRAEQPPKVHFVIGRGYMGEEKSDNYMKTGQTLGIEAPAQAVEQDSEPGKAVPLPEPREQQERDRPIWEF